MVHGTRLDRFASSHARNPRLAVCVALAAIVLNVAALAEEDPSTRWDLTPIYASPEAWEQDRGKLVDGLPALDEYRGRLGESPETLRDALALHFDIDKRARRLYTYAALLRDLDTRESGPQGMAQTIQATFADLAAATSWIDPEILTLSSETLSRFREEEPGLAPYGRFLERLEKRRAHTLDQAGERLLGMAQLVQGDGATIGTLMRNAEIPWPTVTLSDGSEQRIDPSGFSKTRSSSNRDDRVAVFDAFYAQLEAFENTLAATLYATVKEHVFNARARQYDTALDASLAANEVDPAVYDMLLTEIDRALPSLHRYLRIRARILGLDDLAYHDMYPPLVSTIDVDYSWETSKNLVLEALEPLGPEYGKRFRHALENRWVDVYPRPGKRSGAYVSDSAFDVHPYMLLNHNDDYLSASTLAHEGGHLMHSWYSQESQPYATADYSIFVAEVASTCNENLFFDHLVSNAENDEIRLALLGNYLELLRMTVFRQTMFAEFEKVIHEKAEAGVALTSEVLNEVYLGIVRRYYGHDEGVTRVDEKYKREWFYVPHFHYNFYVYQYATSLVAATALSQQILDGGPEVRQRYMEFLRSGSSRPPVQLLQDAGVDMTSPEPIRATVRVMDRTMDEIETILARREN